jgi:hypothetical protein
VEIKWERCGVSETKGRKENARKDKRPEITDAKALGDKTCRQAPKTAYEDRRGAREKNELRAEMSASGARRGRRGGEEIGPSSYQPLTGRTR